MKFYLIFGWFFCNFALSISISLETLPFPNADQQYLNMDASRYSGTVGCIRKEEIERSNPLKAYAAPIKYMVCLEYCRPYREGEEIKAVCHCGSERLLGFGSNFQEAKKEAEVICSYMKQTQDSTKELTCLPPAACFHVYYDDHVRASTISPNIR